MRKEHFLIFASDGEAKLRWETITRRLLQLKNMLSTPQKGAFQQEYKKSGIRGLLMGLPMSSRLFIFLLVLVLTIISGVIAILLATGTFTAGLSESERMVENELMHASQGISQKYGQLSMQAIALAKELAGNMEENMDKLGISASNLQNHPEMLEEIISGGFDRAIFSLLITKSSGVFIILNATVNPALEHAQNSRAGLYIKNMEPNIISSSAPNIIILRGFPSIGRENSLHLHAQWKMEFDISDAPYFHYPITAACLNPELPLSRLYYWSPALTLPDTSEEVMLCSVPLIDSQGNVFGVCGFEKSALLFKLSHMPGRNIYNRQFCVLSPVTEDMINFRQSMFAGGYSARIISKGKDALQISAGRRSFYSYRQNHDSSFLGMHTPIHLYPKDSAFSDQQWVAAIMIPEEDVVNSITRLNLFLFALLTLLVILGIFVSFILSRRFLKPISAGFDIIKSTDLSAAPKTNVPEIDDLIDFLALHKEELYQKARQENLSLSILDQFLENTEKLSPSERDVFNLYVKGHTAKEIAEILFLSVNTIKTHSKHIYTKLDIASREELLLYVKLLQELGQEIK